jgi:hypothetical protein
MLIVPFVCAEFRSPEGGILCRIRPDELRTFKSVPDAVRQDPLFDMLLRDGTIEVPETKADIKRLEYDPVAPAARAEETGADAPAEASRGKRIPNGGGEADAPGSPAPEAADGKAPARKGGKA